MTKQEYLLTVAMEECAEIQQAISKALRFGMDRYNPYAPNRVTNEDNILMEYYQLRGVFSLLFEEGVLHSPDVQVQYGIRDDKMAKVEKYMKLSKECGCLQEAVRHGYWQGEGDGYADGEMVYDVWHCSVCDHCIDDGTDRPELLPKYCPECGAKMDLKVE